MMTTADQWELYLHPIQSQWEICISTPAEIIHPASPDIEKLADHLDQLWLNGDQA